MPRLLFASALLALTACLPAPMHAQMAGMPPQANTPAAPAQPAAPAKRQAPKPARELAPGSGPDKVWVNLKTSVYHCPGDRYYGKTADGRYMTEPAAKSAGAKGSGGKTCFAK